MPRTGSSPPSGKVNVGMELRVGRGLCVALLPLPRAEVASGCERATRADSDAEANLLREIKTMIERLEPESEALEGCV